MKISLFPQAEISHVFFFSTSSSRIKTVSAVVAENQPVNQVTSVTLSGSLRQAKLLVYIFSIIGFVMPKESLEAHEAEALKNRQIVEQNESNCFNTSSLMT